MAEVSVQKTGSQAAPAKASEPAAPRSHPLTSLRHQMDRLFDDFFSGSPLASFGRGFETDPWRSFQGAMGMAYPAIDTAETDKEYRLTAELPGMGDKDVDVTIANGVLTITGEKKDESERREQGYYMSERRYGSFQRALRLPEGIDEGRITADLANGVLTVTMPKSESATKQRKVEIKKAG